MAVSVQSVELRAMDSGEASETVDGRTLRIRAYRQINGSNIICDYTVDGVYANRGDAISFLATGKLLRERS